MNKQLKISDRKYANSEQLIRDLSKIDLSLVRAGRAGNEENVKNIIVVPMLELLGYNKEENMDWEHPVLRRKRIDIALFLSGNDKRQQRVPSVIVETKSLDDYLSPIQCRKGIR